MATEPSAGTSPPSRDDEVDALRQRIAHLERELAEQSARANAAIAAAEDRSYWLDRMHIDLNAVMRRPAAQTAFSVVARVVRVLRGLLRRLR
jgi:hypothetical protein